MKILKTFNGANDISVNNPGVHTFNSEANWTLAALELFKKSKDFTSIIIQNVLHQKIQHLFNLKCKMYLIEKIIFIFRRIQYSTFIKYYEILGSNIYFSRSCGFRFWWIECWSFYKTIGIQRLRSRWTLLGDSEYRWSCESSWRIHEDISHKE